MASFRPKSRVALTSGGGRYDNVCRALELISADIDLGARRSVLIKPNLVSTTVQLASTHAEALRAVIEFVRQRYSGRLILAEGTGMPAMQGYRNFGYLETAKKYDVELADLSQDDTVPVQVYDRDLRPLTLRYSRLIAESDFRISVSPAKTHDEVVVTLTLKNVIMGGLYHQLPAGGSGWVRNLMRQAYWHIPSLLKYSRLFKRVKATVVEQASDDDRLKMHQGYPVHHLNLFLVGREYLPQLSVIDGYQGMEGDGPAAGGPVDWGICIASSNPVAADCLAAQLMGFQFEDIGYLWYMVAAGLGPGHIQDMEILGSAPEPCRRPFKPHPTFPQQRGWRDEQVNKLLGRLATSG